MSASVPQGQVAERARPARAAWATALLVLLAALAGAQAASDGGAELSTVLRGEVSPAAAFVRVEAARVTVRASAQRQGGITVGVASWDAVECELTIKSTLERAVREVRVELVLGVEAPEGLVAGLGKPRGRRGDSDEESAPPSRDATRMSPIPGWKLHLSLDELPAGASRSLPCRQALPPLEEAVRPSSLGQLTFEARVVGYRVPGMALPRALELVRRGTAADQRSAFLGYGEAVRSEARAFDEQILLGLLGALPEREGRELQRVNRQTDRQAARQNDRQNARQNDRQTDRQTGRPQSPRGGPTPPSPGMDKAQPRTALEFAFLLRACRRIGGQPTLEGLIMNEQRLGDTAPPLPPRLDEAHPPENADLLPPVSFAAAVHEAIVEVAHHNIAGLFLLLHAPSPGPPPVILEAAHALADAESLDEPDSWLEAAATLPADTLQFNPDTDREGRLPIVAIMAKYGGPEVIPVLGRALEAEELPLRDEAALALVRRGVPGLTLLLGALDTEDEARRAPVVGALSSLESADAGGRGDPLDPTDAFDRDVLEHLVAARGVAVEPGISVRELVARLEAVLLAARRKAVEEQLARAEQLVAARADDPAIGRVLDEAKARSPRTFVELRERVARIAVTVYRARAAAGRTDAVAALDEVERLGPIAGSEFASARRDARIAAARALAERDLDGALRLLGAAGASMAGDGAAPERLVSQELILAALDRALDGRDAQLTRALLDRAVANGVPNDALEGRRRRLRMITVLPQLAAGAVLVGALCLGAVVALLRRRRRAGAGGRAR